jgi:hypothetical protein
MKSLRSVLSAHGHAAAYAFKKHTKSETFSTGGAVLASHIAVMRWYLI